MAHPDSFATRDTLEVDGTRYGFFNLNRLDTDISRMPVSLRVLLENLLRNEDGERVRAEEIAPLARWQPATAGSSEVGFTPARVLLQDFTGVPAVVDLATMRDAMAELGGDPQGINPLAPAELVVDHSVQVDQFGSAGAWAANTEREYQRNEERYTFLRWGQNALDNFQVVPAESGIVHQVNLEYLGRGVFAKQTSEGWQAYPDTLVGTDSHTTMINGLGVLGWGVGGIEAEAAMLGQPISMLIPEVVGVRLEGRLPEGATATDLVLTLTERLRAEGVVGAFVEFFGPALAQLPLADRATIANMAPEYGATMGFFPVDQATLDYLRASGRPEERVRLTEAYMRTQGLFWTPETPEPTYNRTLSFDLGGVEPSLAGPKRPQDRIALSAMKSQWQQDLSAVFDKSSPASAATTEAWDGEGGDVRSETASKTHADPGLAGVPVSVAGESGRLHHGDVVVAAITSCTNTSNPSVMLAAGLLARNAAARGLKPRPWVKTSLAPGSRVVTDYLESAGLLSELAALGFHLVGYGCTTCIGNSGPLPEGVEQAIDDGDLVASSVLSGNRNFEGRIHPKVRANYLASPPLVVAYALAGTVDRDLTREPLGTDTEGQPVYLRELWPTPTEVADLAQQHVRPELFREDYAHIFEGDAHWRALPAPEGDRYQWQPESTYVQRPPFFEGIAMEPEPLTDIGGARVLARLGDSVTTDHISPAGAIHQDSPAGRYLIEQGVDPVDFNSYGARRGNHEVMLRGTFANVRLRNQLAPGTEGGWTRHQPTGEEMSIFEASVRYANEGTPLVVLAGREYGTGSSRDWAAKGTRLLGVRAVLATSYERIHRSNLVGMGVLPLQFREGEDADRLGLTGSEAFDITGLTELTPGGEVAVTARREDGGEQSFRARVRIDTPNELSYFRHGGILHYVLRQMAAG